MPRVYHEHCMKEYLGNGVWYCCDYPNCQEPDRYLLVLHRYKDTGEVMDMDDKVVLSNPDNLEFDEFGNQVVRADMEILIEGEKEIQNASELGVLFILEEWDV